MSKSVVSTIAFTIGALGLGITAAHGQAAAWQQQVARIFAAKQSYPRVAQMRGEEGTARVKIYVGADGAIQRSELVAASGSTTLDKEALAIAAKAGSLPPPPGGATALTVPLTWKLL